MAMMAASLSRESHIAVMKDRFARIISKAKRGTLYDHEVSPSLPRNPVSHLADMRVAARMALENMEKAVQLDDGIHFLQQLAAMCGCSEGIDSGKRLESHFKTPN